RGGTAPERPAPGAVAAVGRRGRDRGQQHLHQHHPRRGLLRGRPLPVGGVRLRPLRPGADPPRRAPGRPADDPRRAAARGLHDQPGDLRRTGRGLRHPRPRQHRPRRLRDGALGLRAGGQGGVLAAGAHHRRAGSDALSRWTRVLLACLVLATGACTSLSPLQRERALEVAARAQSTLDTCDRADACADPSPLRALATRAYAQSSPEAPRHYALLLDYGQDALLARLNLIRGAQRAIDLQTYIFDEDDAGHLVLDELLVAARRAV